MFYISLAQRLMIAAVFSAFAILVALWAMKA